MRQKHDGGKTYSIFCLVKVYDITTSVYLKKAARYHIYNMAMNETQCAMNETQYVK